MGIDRWDIAEGIEDGLVFRPGSGKLVEYDDHQRELAALREELANIKNGYKWESERAALLLDALNDCESSLADAERRNAILIDALTEERRIRLLGQQPDIHWESLRDDRRACYAKTDAALNKPEEVKS